MDAILEEVKIALHAVWRRRWLALAVAWAIALLGWLVISMIPNTYESSARVFVQPQSIIPQTVGMTTNDQQQGIENVRQTLLSADNLQKVIQGTELDKQAKSPRDMAAMVARLQTAITIKSQQDNLFLISADLSGGGFSDAENAKLSQAVVARLLDLFVSGNLAGDRSEALRSLKFLDKQLAERGAQLQQAQQKQVEFEQKYMGMLPGTGSIEDRMGTARSQLSDIETNLAAAQSSLSAVNGQIAATPATIPGPPVAGAPSGARERIAGLQAQLAEDQAKGWTDQHPDVVAIRQQIARLSSAARSEPVSGANSQPNPSYVSLRSIQADKQATVAALSARRAEIQSNLNEFAAKQSSEPEVAAQQAQLSRDYDVLKSQYDKLLSDREQVKLRVDAANSGAGAQLRVIDPPSFSRIPASPNRPLLLTAVLILAVGAGAGVAWARSKLQTSFSTPEALAEASGLPVLGAVSLLRGARQRAQEAQHLRWFAGAGGALAGAYALLLALVFVQRGLMG